MQINSVLARGLVSLLPSSPMYVPETPLISQVREETSRWDGNISATQEPPKIRVYAVHALRFEDSFLVISIFTLHT
jgi:hypothetical protein